MENGTFEAFNEIRRKTTVTPAQDYFVGHVLKLTKNPDGDR